MSIVRKIAFSPITGIVVATLLLGLGVVATLYYANTGDELEAYVLDRTALLEEFIHEPRFVNALATEVVGVPPEEETIAVLEARWQEVEDTDFLVTQYLTNTLGRSLLSFQETRPEYLELFVTNDVGLLVGTTNKTSDVYQADEKWWQDAYAGGVGYIRRDIIEYDESARSWGMPVYFTVSKGGVVLGVVKAVISIQRDLYEQ